MAKEPIYHSVPREAKDVELKRNLSRFSGKNIMILVYLNDVFSIKIKNLDSLLRRNDLSHKDREEISNIAEGMALIFFITYENGEILYSIFKF